MFGRISTGRVNVNQQFWHKEQRDVMGSLHSGDDDLKCL